jgi:hypothetical protein
MCGCMCGAGERRRRMLGQGQDSTFFDATNQSASSTRDKIALETLDELLSWLATGQGVYSLGGLRTVAITTQHSTRIMERSEENAAPQVRFVCLFARAPQGMLAFSTPQTPPVCAVHKSSTTVKLLVTSKWSSLSPFARMHPFLTRTTA